jgi:hypothetical protein
VHTGHLIGDPIAAVGSIITLADMVLFGWLVFRRQAGDATVSRSAVPAE